MTRWGLLATYSTSRLMWFVVEFHMVLVLHILCWSHTVYLSQTSVVFSPVLLACRQFPSWNTRWKLIIIIIALRLLKSKAFIRSRDVYARVVLLIRQVKLVLHQSLYASLLFGFCGSSWLYGDLSLRLLALQVAMTWTSTAVVTAEIIQSRCSNKNNLWWDLLMLVDSLIVCIFHAFRMF